MVSEVQDGGQSTSAWFRPRPEVCPRVMRGVPCLDGCGSLSTASLPQTIPGDEAITEIHRDEHCQGIYIGGIGAARNFAGLNERGIKSVLDVAAGDPRQQAGLELPAVAEHGTAAAVLCANTSVNRVEEVSIQCRITHMLAYVHLLGFDSHSASMHPPRHQPLTFHKRTAVLRARKVD
jgi:hypothetical protein